MIRIIWVHLFYFIYFFIKSYNDNLSIATKELGCKAISNIHKFKNIEMHSPLIVFWLLLLQVSEGCCT